MDSICFIGLVVVRVALAMGVISYILSLIGQGSTVSIHTGIIYFRDLKKLDLTGISYFTNQPMAAVLLEEHLPDCVIVGMELPTADPTPQIAA